MNKILTIVVAGGSGTRMGTELPKQFLELVGEPIVMRTLRRMEQAVLQYVENSVNRDEGASACGTDSVNNSVNNAPGCSETVNNPIRHEIVLVLPEPHIALWSELCRRYDFRIPHRVVVGGETRFHSVRNGLNASPGADVVLVQDGVRPFASDRVVAGVLDETLRSGAAVPAIPVTDSLREMSDEGEGVSRPVDRTRFRAVQTPQGFSGAVLYAAYEQPFDPLFTDDASVVERTGHLVKLTFGEPSNLKITTPEDLTIAEIFLKKLSFEAHLSDK